MARGNPKVAETGTDSVDTAVARWQSQLLQLNRRNNLLYFKWNSIPKEPQSRRRPTVRCVPITGFGPDEIDEYLQSSRQGRTFDFAARRRQRRTFDLESVTEEPVGPNDDIEFVGGDLSTDIDPLALQRVLLRFLRKEREWLEEQGLNILYLAVGFLEWIDEEREPAKSPLLLLPCDLQRASPRDPFVLSREDNDATANATLHHKLRELGLELPELNHETYGAYLDEVSNLVEVRTGWRVTHEVVLSTFQYTKLAMWGDLQQMRTVGVTHPLVRRLAGEPLTLDSNGSLRLDALPSESELAGGLLDDILDLHQEVTVLPADHSQLRAVAAARAGGNLVIHGPPGTGKSQTIVNIISNLLTHGRRVLFVSEKSVALDVVKGRLDEESLGVFCLDMHSERASKTSVYEQLRNSIEDSGQVVQFDYDFAELEASRKTLNEVVRALHEPRPSLERSVFQIHGEYAQLRDLPDVQFRVTDAESVGDSQLRAIGALTERIARRPDEFKELTTSKWRFLKTRSSSVGLADRLRRDAVEAERIVNKASTQLREQAELLGVRAPATLEEASNLGALARHLDSKPMVLRHWLSKETLTKLCRVGTEQREQQRQARELAEDTGRAFGRQAPGADYQQLSRSVHASLTEIGALRQAFGPKWSARLMPDPARLLETARQVQADASETVAALNDLASSLGTDTQTASLAESLRLIDCARQLIAASPVSESWTDPNRLDRIGQLVGTAREAHLAVDSAEKEFFGSFDPELIDAVDREMLVRFRSDHQSGVRRLLFGRSAFQSDIRLLRGHARTRDRLDVRAALSVVERAIETQSLRQDWEEAYAAVEPHIGGHARSRETDWAHIEVQIHHLANLLRSWPWNQDDLRQLLADRVALEALRGPQQAAQARLDSLQASLQRLGSEGMYLGEIGPAGVLDTVRRGVSPLQRLETATNVLTQALVHAPSDWLAFGDLVERLARLQSIEADEQASRESLGQDFGEWFRDRNTDWDAVIEAIQWCRVLLDKAGQRLSNRLREIVCKEPAPFDPTRIAESIESLQSEYPRDLAVLNRRFDMAKSPWDSWAAVPFREMSDWIRSVHEDADNATNWIEFKLAADEIDRTFGPETVQRIREATDDAALVPGIVNRRLFTMWLDDISQQDSRLRDFTGRDHEAIRREFRSLDRQLPQVLREQARIALFDNYPKSRASVTRAGQLGVLRGELTKRRRQMSVRQLLGAAPQLIQALKPCFLMSPLAVSQYLERTGVASANLHFDTVIFDEASQVLPEHAVPAISRANQTIVVGDRRQLPPTTVFQHRYEHEDGDDDGDDETDWFEGRESILDVMVGMAGSGVAEHYLGVHYRSRHDSLIRYSNHYFYDDRLLTFPSPRKAAAHGVEAVYLPHGRYDAGGSRTNRMEAERIVELVFELLRTRPESESIGVVALSRAQADLIDTLIDEARLYQPEFDHHFSSEHDERFFVKNLENVQGDERDHIFLSVGYGPTNTGQVYNRFGPINNEGGERRLNVAVSRARRSMTIVHSLRPEDISSESRGARLLRRYLEFARNPDTALEQNLTISAQAETESPFEEAVRRALVERGHRVDVQVGGAGYRIDLAIQAEDGEGYALGIECDGATYHSAPAARDRDWLRQSVLEDLGWRIHRVWSRAWIQNPQRELDAIERALNEAESPGSDSEDAQNGTQIEVDSDVTNERQLTEVSDDEWAEHEQDSTYQDQAEPDETGEGNALFDAYREADLTTFRVGQELRLESISRLRELITEVVRVEGPVHRDILLERVRRRFRASRMRGATRQRFLNEIRRAAHVNLMWLPEERAGAAAQHLFLMDPAGADSISPRAPTSDDTRRRVEHISLAELKAGVLVCAEMLFGAGRDDLIAETARQFGYRRTGTDIARRIGKAVDRLVHAGKLTGDDQMLTAADPA